jgi:hypothetical protein
MGVAAQSDVFPQSRHRLIEDYHCSLLVDGLIVGYMKPR